jgi:predicted RNA binding protein YcfA (HicA-like mRNA interferase family)
MTPYTGRSFCRLLEENGWILLRIKGSHHIYGKNGRTERISVPVHGNKELSKGLVQHLLKIVNADSASA